MKNKINEILKLKNISNAKKSDTLLDKREELTETEEKKAIFLLYCDVKNRLAITKNTAYLKIKEEIEKRDEIKEMLSETKDDIFYFTKEQNVLIQNLLYSKKPFDKNIIDSYLNQIKEDPKNYNTELVLELARSNQRYKDENIKVVKEIEKITQSIKEVKSEEIEMQSYYPQKEEDKKKETKKRKNLYKR